MSGHLLRQYDLLGLRALDDVACVHIIGTGGIGGPTALILAKMGICKINLYDKDTVEEHNVGSQLFGYKDLGEKKVECIKKHVEDFIPKDACEIQCYHGDIFEGSLEILKADMDDNKLNIIVLSVDSNDVRRGLYQWFDKNLDKEQDTYIVDPRMGGLGFTVYAKMLTLACANYEEFTPTDSDVPDDMCTARAICFNTFGVAAYASAIIRKIILRKPFTEVQVCMNNLVTIEM